MTYALAISFQKSVYTALLADADLATLLGGAIYDAPLSQEFNDSPKDYVTLGEETVKDGSTGTSYGALHDFNITVHSNRDGYSVAKNIAAKVCDVLLDANLALERGQLVGLRFRSARARAGRPPNKRTIVLTFRAVLEDTNTYTG